MAVEYTGQIVREAPEIEAYKTELLKRSLEQIGKPLSLPAVQAAGLSSLQQQASTLGQRGIGAYQPYLSGGASTLGSAVAGTNTALQGINSVNVPGAFAPGTTATAAVPVTALRDPYAKAAGMQTSFAPYISQTQGVNPSLAMGMTYTSLTDAKRAAAPGITGTSAVDTSMAPALTGTQAVNVPGAMAPGATAIQQGIGGIQGAAAMGYDPSAGALAYMNPYQQLVTQNALAEMQRQAGIQQNQAAAQAVQAGAFGGTREGVQRAEMARGLQDVMGQRITQDYAQNYAQAQQAAMQAFNEQAQRQLAAGQAVGAQGQALGALGLQGSQAQLAQAGQIGDLLGQQAQLGLGQAQQLGMLGLQANQQDLARAAQLSDIAAREAQLNLGQAQQAGQLFGQQGQLGLAQTGQMADTLAKQSQLDLSRANQLASLGAQSAQMQMQQDQTYGSLAQGLGSLGVQQAALGQAASQLGAQDVNTLSTLGALQQQVAQNQLDAARMTATQTAMSPYQRLGFLSDIYKGAPSTQMALTANAAPSASPLQTALGLGVGALSAAAGVKQGGGLFG